MLVNIFRRTLSRRAESWSTFPTECESQERRTASRAVGSN